MQNVVNQQQQQQQKSEQIYFNSKTTKVCMSVVTNAVFFSPK